MWLIKHMLDLLSSVLHFSWRTFKGVFVMKEIDRVARGEKLLFDHSTRVASCNTFPPMNAVQQWMQYNILYRSCKKHSKNCEMALNPGIPSIQGIPGLWNLAELWNWSTPHQFGRVWIHSNGQTQNFPGIAIWWFSLNQDCEILAFSANFSIFWKSHQLSADQKLT